MTEIKPCKVCGGPGTRAMSFSLGDGDRDKYYIVCEDCEFYGPGSTTQEGAVKLWNELQEVQ